MLLVAGFLKGGQGKKRPNGMIRNRANEKKDTGPTLGAQDSERGRQNWLRAAVRVLRRRSCCLSVESTSPARKLGDSPSVRLGVGERGKLKEGFPDPRRDI